VVALFAEKFALLQNSADYQFVVPEKSIKHQGGVAASSQYIFGRTGRALNEVEQSMHKGEIILARIPIAFATGEGTGVTSLTEAELMGLFSGKITNWQEVGGNDLAVVVVGREDSEAIFSQLKNSYPMFQQAKFSRIYKRDHQVVSFLGSVSGVGAIAFGASPNFVGLNIIDLKEFSEGIEVGLVYDLKNSEHTLVQGARDYAASSDWADAIRGVGLLPPDVEK
jgi:phosphate transport system substrate-binding protein